MGRANPRGARIEPGAGYGELGAVRVGEGPWRVTEATTPRRGRRSLVEIFRRNGEYIIYPHDP